MLINLEKLVNHQRLKQVNVNFPSFTKENFKIIVLKVSVNGAEVNSKRQMTKFGFCIEEEEKSLSSSNNNAPKPKTPPKKTKKIIKKENSY